MPEWSNGAVSKTVVPLTGDRGFESLPLRQRVCSHRCLSWLRAQKPGLPRRVNLDETRERDVSSSTLSSMSPHPSVELEDRPDEDRRSRLVFATRDLPREPVAQLFASVSAVSASTRA